jgi:signal transduction histidine kinase
MCTRQRPRTLDGVSPTATAHRRSGTGGFRAALDVAMAGAALAGTLALLSHGGIRPSSDDSGVASTQLDLVGVLLAVCSTVPLVAWRRSPFGVFVVTAAATVLLVGLGYPLDLALGPAVALFLLAAHRPPQTRWNRHTTSTAVGMLIAYVVAAAAAHGDVPGSYILHTGLAWAVAWFAGERTRLRHAHLADLRERAGRRERDAERERLLAVAQERARIARDLHDSAGHAISVIAVRAGAARLRHHEDPDRSLAALEAIEELARQTVDEIDHLVGRLRETSNSDPSDGDGSVETPPGLSSLDSLIARHTAAGLAVTLDAVGTPRPLSGPADQAVYRILQEALTNAARHGGGSARVELVFGDTAVDITVTNPVFVAHAPRPGGGHGLVGMRERAVLLGGELDIERDDGTFRTHARIPFGSALA